MMVSFDFVFVDRGKKCSNNFQSIHLKKFEICMLPFIWPKRCGTKSLLMSS